MRELSRRSRTIRAAARVGAAAVLGVAVAAAVPTTSASAVASASAAPTAAPLVVDTTSGRLRGTATPTAREFLGVRYAVAPTGARRWTLPVAPPKPTGTVRATAPGPECSQTTAGPASSTATSEDCLFLNVTTPADTRPGERLPVVVWWHGGGFTSGSGSAYDAQRMASQGRVVVVTVNYRLGVFGYLALPGLAGSGDFGFADQILATQWAKQNAAAFGGDPGNLSVFGESAGAMSACALLGSPAAVGLVDKVAMSSGGACQLHWPQNGLLPRTPPQTPYLDLPDAQALGRAEATSLGCSGATALTCLRGQSTAELLGISGDFSNALAYSTPLLPQDPAQAVRSGDVVHVPVLSSGNHDEERAFVGGAQLTDDSYYTATTYRKLLKAAFGQDAPRVEGRYPLAAFPSAADAWATLITDASWACPTLAGNAALAAHGSPVHAMEFDDPTAPDVNQVAAPDFDPRAAHATDLPYLFDLNGQDLLTTPAQHRLATRMVAAWTSFAHTGVPAPTPGAVWPPVAGPDGPTFRFGPTTDAVVDVGTEHQCSFWKSVPEA